MDAMSGTDIVGAGRDESLIYAMVAQVTFVGDVLAMIIGDGIIGTCVDARLTTGAQIVIHDDNAVVALLDGFLRTHVGTGGIIAMPAQVHPKAEIQFSINYSGAILLNANQFNTVNRLIFLLAGHLTGLTAPT